jgi:4-amino-4-deoxy-L-arabinose transferase-like glycosyltransferase
MTAGRAPWTVLVVVLLLLLASVALRVRAAARPGIWADEVFSLAMATGHSLEHPAAEADASLGDFVEPPEAASAREFRRYAEHDLVPAGADRVIRAVLRSDTSPPLYYLLLNLWTRGFGTSDGALRLFSVWWAVLCLPLLWLAGRELGGTRVAWSACLLFAYSPVAFYYSVEGRMYSLVWCEALMLAWLTLRLAHGARPGQAALWVLAGAAGLLTHYFFAFVWLASLTWLWLAAPAARRQVVLLAAVTALVVLPWYVQVPASLARWRVTGDWLVGALDWPWALATPFRLAESLLAGGSDLGSWRWARAAGIALLALLTLALVRGNAWREVFSRPALLLWGSLAAACTGPLVFDVIRQTTASTIPRYALPGLPAAVLLAAFAMSRLPPRVHLAILGALLLAWLPGTWRTATARVPRPWEPYPQLAAQLASWARPGDVVLVRSIPSGVIGVARYLEREVPVASWVTRLGTRRVPADLERILRGRQRAALVTIHAAGARDPVDPWLRAHERLVGHETFRHSSAEVLYFAPASGGTFFSTDLARGWE